MSKDAVAGGFTRPAPPYEAPDGARWEAVQADGVWGIAGPGRKCRYRSAAQRSCGKPAVLVCRRGIQVRIDWNYCAGDALAHYGTWAEGEKVMTWELRECPAA